MTEEAVSAADMSVCDCEPCKRKAGQPHNVRSGVIHSYSSTPRNGWTPRRTPAEVGSNTPTFGIELETSIAPRRQATELPGRPVDPGYFGPPEEREAYMVAARDWSTRNRAHVQRQYDAWAAEGNLTADEAASLAGPRGLWHPKHDGSVSGPEFASQPATLAYWRSQRGVLAGMFKALLHGGVRSHDGDTCGAHVNVGTTAFDDADHLYRFASLMQINPRWTTRMSQRTHASVQHWSRFDPLADAQVRRDWARSVFTRGYAYQDRYAICNASNPGRIEVRVPRGTLRLDRFFARLEWIASMVEYTRNTDNPIRPTEYMHWARATGEYAELVRYMVERFPARMSELNGAVPAARLMAA